LEKVEIKSKYEIEAQGEDLLSLLFHFLDEFLYIFSAEPYFIVKKVKILEFDRLNFTIKAVGFGEIFNLKKHPQGTEVKAITYVMLKIKKNYYYMVSFNMNFL